MLTNHLERARARKYYEYVLLAKAYFKNDYGERKFESEVLSPEQWYAEVAIAPIYLEDGQTGIIDRFVSEIELRTIIGALRGSLDELLGPSSDLHEHANYVKAEISDSGILSGTIQILSVQSEMDLQHSRLLFEANFIDGVAHGLVSEWNEYGFPRTSTDIQFGKKHGTAVVYDLANYSQNLLEVSSYKGGWQYGLRERFHFESNFVKTRSSYRWGERVGAQQYFSIEEQNKSVLLQDHDARHPKNAYQTTSQL